MIWTWDLTYVFAITNLVFYLGLVVILTFIYRRKMKIFYSFCYSLSVMWFFSSWWEMPSWVIGMLSIKDVNIFRIVDQCMVLSYFFPLLIFVGVFNIKLKLTKWKILALAGGLIVAGLSVVFVPNYFDMWDIYSSTAELLAIGLRAVNIVPLAWACVPDTTKCRFSVRKE